MRTKFDQDPKASLRLFLNELGILHTEKTIRQFESHPEYPGFWAAHHTLKGLGLDNLVIKADYSRLKGELPKPALVSVEAEAGCYLVLKDIDEEEVQVVDEKGRSQTYSKAEFSEVWDGIVLICDPENPAEEAHYHHNKKEQFIRSLRAPFALVAIAALALMIGLNNKEKYDLFHGLFLLTKALGLVVTLPLLFRIFDKRGSLVQKLCPAKTTNSKVNCSSILDSGAATIYGLISWSEIGFLYFTVLTIFLFAFPSGGAIGIVSVLAIAAMPYTAYAVFYQWKIAGRWCRLCLWVQTILFLEALLALYYLLSEQLVSAPGSPIISLIVTGLVVLALFILLKPVMLFWTEGQQTLSYLKKFKRNKNIFEFLRIDLDTIDQTNSEPLVLGNPEGDHVLTIVTSPSCKSCTEVHKQLFDMIARKRNTRVEEVFLVGKNTSAYDVARAMLYLHETKDAEPAEKTIADFYFNYGHRLTAWLKKYRLHAIPDHYGEEVLTSQAEWASSNGVQFTPTIYYNGKQLPSSYGLEDIDYMID